MNMIFFLVLVAVATFCQNLTGFAFGLIFVGIAGASSLLSIADAANIASLLSLVQAVGFMRANRLKPDWGLLGPLLASSAVGLVAGVLLLQWLSGNMLSMLRILLGVSVVVCAILLLRQKQVQAEMSVKPAQWTAGIASGLLGGLFATPGPPLVYHLYRQPLDRLLIVHCLISMGVVCGVWCVASRHGGAGWADHLHSAAVDGSGRAGRGFGDLVDIEVPAADCAAHHADRGVRAVDSLGRQPAGLGLVDEPASLKNN